MTMLAGVHVVVAIVAGHHGHSPRRLHVLFARETLHDDAKDTDEK